MGKYNIITTSTKNPQETRKERLFQIHLERKNTFAMTHKVFGLFVFQTQGISVLEYIKGKNSFKKNKSGCYQK